MSEPTRSPIAIQASTVPPRTGAVHLPEPIEVVYPRDDVTWVTVPDGQRHAFHEDGTPPY